MDLPPKDVVAEIIVFDHDTFTKDDVIGQVEINLSHDSLLCGIEKLFKLKLILDKKDAGLLYIGVTPFGFGTTLKDQEEKLRKQEIENRNQEQANELNQFQKQETELRSHYEKIQNLQKEVQQKREALEQQLALLAKEQADVEQKIQTLSQERDTLEVTHKQNQQEREQKHQQHLRQLEELKKAVTPVYRYWNAAKKDHSYSTAQQEIGTATKEGYTSEGPSFHVLPSQLAPGTVPVYQYFNASTSDHLYTTNASEIGGVTVKGQSANGYTCEGVLGYIYSDPVHGTLPVYRYWNAAASDSFYTTHPQEVDTVVPGTDGLNGYTCKGILGHALSGTK